MTIFHFCYSLFLGAPPHRVHLSPSGVPPSSRQVGVPNQSYGSWTHFLYVNAFFCSIDAGHVSENALQTEARIDCEQSLSKLGRTGESEMAERESFPMASCFLLSLDFLARLTILRDCSQSKARTRKKKIVLREKRRLPSPEVWAAPTSKVWRHSDRARYSPFPSKRPERNHCSQGGVRAIEPLGEVLLGIHGGGVPPGSLNPDLISDQRLVVFHICFQTRPLKSIPAFRPGL